MKLLNKNSDYYIILKKKIVERISYHIYYHAPIYKNLIYIESLQGRGLESNILRIIKELSTKEYKKYKIVVYSTKKAYKKIESLKENYKLDIHIITHPRLSMMIMEHAKYIVIDSIFRKDYIKRDGQVIIETLNGSPLKHVGRDFRQKEHELGFMQNTLINSDYLIFPSDYAKEKILNAYMIEKIYPGKILMEGYPRNSVFFDNERRNDIKSKLNLESYEIFAYMPTYRETASKKLKKILKILDNELKDDQILFLKLHPKEKIRIKFKKYKRIKAFPGNYDSYDILNISDCLITDYSSVLFDYLNTSRKIILFNYDEENYMKYRGTYIPLDDFPFPKATSIEDLIKELNKPKEYDNSILTDRYCTYDNLNSVKNLCRHVFKGKKVCIEEKIENNENNVLIYAGGLWKNGLTSSLMSLINNVDTKKHNFFISYRQWDEYFINHHVEILDKFPENIEFFPLIRNNEPYYFEEEARNEFFNGEKKHAKTIKKMYERKFRKLYGSKIFQNIIDYDGYGPDQQLFFNSSNVNSVVWVHNNMILEVNTRQNQNPYALKEAYSNYNHVAVVSPDLIEPTSKISGTKNNIALVHNLCNYDNIKRNAEKDLIIDKDNVITSKYSDIDAVLNLKAKKFITIGRFSKEKGHKRLLNSFNRFCNDYPDTHLIIIGGHGPLYEETISLRNKLKYGENITIIKSMSNPMPVLKRCDLFILSSLYEGWPMVLMEAEALEVPVIATDICGMQMLREYNGHIVENSEEGILQGMHDYMDGKVHVMGVDFEEYNKKALNEFYSILK